jgi:hypothetical protein
MGPWPWWAPVCSSMLVTGLGGHGQSRGVERPSGYILHRSSLPIMRRERCTCARRQQSSDASLQAGLAVGRGTARQVAVAAPRVSSHGKPKREPARTRPHTLTGSQTPWQILAEHTPSSPRRLRSTHAGIHGNHQISPVAAALRAMVGTTFAASARVLTITGRRHHDSVPPLAVTSTPHFPSAWREKPAWVVLRKIQVLRLLSEHLAVSFGPDRGAMCLAPSLRA